MGKESYRDQQYVEHKPVIGGFGIYDDLDGGFERKPFTLEEELAVADAFGIGIEVDPSGEDLVVISATPEQEALYVRAITAHAEQVEASDAVAGSIFELPKDIYGIADLAREERVIFEFDSREYKKI